VFSKYLFPRVVKFPFSWVFYRYFPLGFVIFYIILFYLLCLLERLVSYFIFHSWFSFSTMFAKNYFSVVYFFLFILHGQFLNFRGFKFSNKT
jgi:hypothetical protein